MKLDRNDNSDGLGKYALILLRELRRYETLGTFNAEISAALETLEKAGALDWGNAGSGGEFFLIRLKDRGAEAALRAYADDAVGYDTEWAHEVYGLAGRAKHHPSKKTPD